LTDEQSGGVPSDPDQALGNSVEERLPVLIQAAEKAAEEQKEPLIKQWLLLLPRLVKFLSCLVRSDDLSAGWKIRCALVLTYVFSPLDLIPDMIPVIGLLDDLYLVLLLLDQLLNRIPEPVFSRCWNGPRDAIDDVRGVLSSLERVLPETPKRILASFFGSPDG
jgi:uncharacterized membrane protein YkvA (DUF1232 family)